MLTRLAALRSGLRHVRARRCAAQEVQQLHLRGRLRRVGARTHAPRAAGHQEEERQDGPLHWHSKGMSCLVRGVRASRRLLRAQDDSACRAIAHRAATRAVEWSVARCICSQLISAARGCTGRAALVVLALCATLWVVGASPLHSAHLSGRAEALAGTQSGAPLSDGWRYFRLSLDCNLSMTTSVALGPHPSAMLHVSLSNALCSLTPTPTPGIFSKNSSLHDGQRRRPPLRLLQGPDWTPNQQHAPPKPQRRQAWH